MTPNMRTYQRLRSRYSYADYEIAKQVWIMRNPTCTPEQYQAAMVRIAARMRL